MIPDTNNATQSHWSESSGLTHLLRVFRFAVHPEKLLLTLLGILLTLGWGFTLDALWTRTGHGIAANEMARYIASPAESPPGEKGPAGIFEVFKAYEMSCIRDAVESVRYGRFIGEVRAGEPVDIAPPTEEQHPARGALANIVLMGRGVVWLVTEHLLYAVLFIPVFLVIWGLAGGALCRIAALQFAREERITLTDALRFARSNLIGGFVTAPLIPLVLCLIIGVLLLIGGAFMSIPWLGDIVAGVLFCFALFGGFLIALLLVAMVTGGSFFWPTVAVEGSDSFDAVSRSFSYVSARPLRVLWYAVWLILFGSFAWLLVMFIAWLTAASTHLFVGLGTDLFTSSQGVPDKLTALWAPPTFERLHDITGPIQGIEWVGAGLVGLWVMVLSGLVWSFLASFYFSGSTIAYFLIRRDVDGTDLGEVEMDEDEPATTPAPDAPVDKPDDPPANGDVSLPVVNSNE